MIKRSFILLVLLLTMVINLWGQQSEYYQKAAQLYREAASKTKCPDRASVLREYEEWNERMAKALAGTLSTSVGPQPTTPVPPCDGDMMGGGSQMNQSAVSSDPVAEMQMRQQQTQIEFNNAQEASSIAYENALNSGKKTSGAILEGFLAGAEQTSDPTLANAYVGTGLVMGGIMALVEKKAERLEAAEEEQRLANIEKTKNMAKMKLIADKEEFIGTLENNFFKTNFAATIRQAFIIWYPTRLNSEFQEIFISNPIAIQSYSDGSFPLKENIYNSLTTNIPANLRENSSFRYILVYPIGEEHDFQKEFRQIGQHCELINFTPKIVSILVNDANTIKKEKEGSSVDFWGNPVNTKESDKKETQSPPKNDFWNN